MSEEIIEDALPYMEPVEAIKYLAKQGGLLQQAALDLREVSERLRNDQKIEEAGYTFRGTGSGGEVLLDRYNREITVYTVYNGNGYYKTDDHSLLFKRAAQESEGRLDKLVSGLIDATVIIHKAHLDEEHLTAKEKEVLQSLPETLAAAKGVFTYYIERTPVDGSNRELAVQAKRNVDYLSNVISTIGDPGDDIIAHNKGTANRQAALISDEEIQGNALQKRVEGIQLLDEAHKEAAINSPAYRRRVEKEEAARKDLPKLTMRPNSIEENAAIEPVLAK